MIDFGPGESVRTFEISSCMWRSVAGTQLDFCRTQWTSLKKVVKLSSKSHVTETQGPYGSLMGPLWHLNWDDGCCGPIGPRFRLRITIISDDHFDTALDFDVILEDPEGCMLDPRLHVSRVS